MRRSTSATFAACVAGALLAGCAAPADLDGEVGAASGATLGPSPTAAPGQVATPVVVDTDLGADDLVALAFLLRHPGVHVEAVTVPDTGLVGCDAGVDVLAGVFAALDVEAVPVACGRRAAGPGARELPAAWRAAAAGGSGLAPVPGAVVPVAETAAELLARRARDTDGLVAVALAPMTNLAELATEHPVDYARLAGVHAMAGSVAGPVVEGAAEWNAAADPTALATVLAGPVPVTVVPEDAVPVGTPEALHAPVVDRVAAAAQLPAWWDLATVAALVVPDAGTVEAARWVLAPSAPGRLEAAGDGSVRVYRSMDREALGAEYDRVFTSAGSG